MITRSRARAMAAQNNSRSSNTRSTSHVVSRGTSTTSRRPNNTIAGSVSARSKQIIKLKKAELKLVRSCNHVILLNDKIQGLTIRYLRARAECFKSFRYNLRVRLAAVEGVRNVFYEYARDRAEEVAELRKELFNQNVQIVTGSEPDESDSEPEEYYTDSDGEDDD